MKAYNSKLQTVNPSRRRAQGGRKKTTKLVAACVLLCLALVLPGTTYGQNAGLAWARSMGVADDAGAYANANDVAVDAAGNVYTAGRFEGTIDFDPGEGEFSLTSGGEHDIFLVKLDRNGEFVWAKAIGGEATDGAGSVVVDEDGNVYLEGIFSGAVDLDPGDGVFELTSVSGSDVFLAKLDSNGDLIWARGLGVSADLKLRCIALDAEGKVYMTGSFSDTVDFDPGAGTFDMTSTGSQDCFISKLTGNGEFVWAKAMGGTEHNSASGVGVAVDVEGNVYTTGDFYGYETDFDPGDDSFTLGQYGGNFISKLSADGAFVWAGAIMGGEAVSTTGIAVDAWSNLIITGRFEGTVDFDPTEGSFELTAPGGEGGRADAFVFKLDGDGAFEWVKAIGGESYDSASHVAVDEAGNVYIAGGFQYTVDFDPGDGIFELTSTTSHSRDVFVWKLDADGAFLWAKSMGGRDTDSVAGMALDAQGNVHMAGSFQYTVDFDPNEGVFELTSVGRRDIFVAKLEPRYLLAGGPSTAFTTGDAISYTLNYFDVQSISLEADDVELIATGTAAGTVSVSGDGTSTRTITVGNLSGRGTLAISVAAGTAAAFGSGSVEGSGPSLTFFIDDTPPSVTAEGATFAWAKGLIGNGESSMVFGVAADALDNVYVTGLFAGTVDFDPGPAIFELTSLTSYGYSVPSAFILKMDGDGNFIWAKALLSTMGSQATGIALNDSGGLVITGYAAGTTDFDPGEGSLEISSPSTADMFILKLSAEGELEWLKIVEGAQGAMSLGTGLQVDGTGHIYSTGWFKGTVDFDPGQGVFELESQGNGDVFVQKLDADGNFLWTKTMSGEGSGQAIRIVLHGANAVYLLGTFDETMNVSPDAGVFELESVGADDVFVAKLDAAGNLVWAVSTGGVNHDVGNQMAVAEDGAVYVTGAFEEVADFDPGDGEFTLTSAGGSDGFLWKLDADGDLVWARAFGGTGNTGGTGVAINGTGEVLLTGGFEELADLDPGTGVFNVASMGAADAFVARFTQDGQLQWGQTMGGPEEEVIFGLTLSPSGALYLAGSFSGAADFLPGPGLFNLTSAAGGKDMFVVRLDDIAGAGEDEGEGEGEGSGGGPAGCRSPWRKGAGTAAAPGDLVLLLAACAALAAMANRRAKFPH